MKIAVEGCAHGELDKIYEAMQTIENQNSIKIDLLIICGDFQSVRNKGDLECMAVPPKYRHMESFYKYYSGESAAPVLTIFIGGNHEASNYLSELPYGGWVCPNIYYMGLANVINFKGVRIAGLSGIFKGFDYCKGHYECPPYDKSTVRTIYHVRNIDVFRLKQVKKHIDICISHDWPRGVYNYGDKEKLIKKKSFFKDEIYSNTLGSQVAEELLTTLKPSYWFAAHLHCKFASVVPHDDSERPFTKFLALDKCLPRRSFLQILDIETPSESSGFELDPEWLCVLQNTNHLLNTTRRVVYMPGAGGTGRWDFSANDEEINDVKKLFENDLKIPENFSMTAPVHNPSEGKRKKHDIKIYPNPQTQLFCKILSLTNPFPPTVQNSSSLSISDFACNDAEASYSSFQVTNPDEISLSDDEELSSQLETDASDVGEFFIDKKGSRKSPSNTIESLDSTDFFIDKSGSHVSSNADLSEIKDYVIEKSHTRVSCKELNSSLEEIQGDKSGFLGLSNAEKFLQNQFCSTPIQEKAIEQFPELKNDSAEVDETKITPLSKKFKRRNYSLYSSEDTS